MKIILIFFLPVTTTEETVQYLDSRQRQARAHLSVCLLYLSLDFYVKLTHFFCYLLVSRCQIRKIFFHIHIFYIKVSWTNLFPKDNQQILHGQILLILCSGKIGFSTKFATMKRLDLHEHFWNLECKNKSKKGNFKQKLTKI